MAMSMFQLYVVGPFSSCFLNQQETIIASNKQTRFFFFSKRMNSYRGTYNNEEVAGGRSAQFRVIVVATYNS